MFWLAVWQAGAMLWGQPLLLPTPVAVLLRVGELSLTGGFWLVTAGSLGRIATGFLLGMVCGALLAVLTSVSGMARAVIQLPMSIIKATPIASFVILALLFIRGSGFSIFISFLTVLPMAWSSLDVAIASTPPDLLEMAATCRMSRWGTLRHLYIPSILPHLLAAARTGMGFAWKSGIAGEVIARPAGTIGTQLYNSKVYLETVDLFAWTAVIILLSLLLERLMIAIAGRVRGGMLS